MINTYRSGHPIQNYFGVRDDSIGFLANVTAECGDLARVKIFGLQFYLVNEPALIREALVEKHETFIIKGGVSTGLARLIGRGILTNRGNQWRESRQQLQPLFQQDALESYRPTMEKRIQESLDRWKTEFSDKPAPFSPLREGDAEVPATRMQQCLPAIHLHFPDPGAAILTRPTRGVCQRIHCQMISVNT
jgi:cytochrome P450